MMNYLTDFLTAIRFNVIQTKWEPADHRAKPLFVQNLINKYWSPSPTINITGQNSNLNLTDENLVTDLPFLLAENSGISDLDLSHNQIKLKTVITLEEKLFRTKIKTLNLSQNPLDEAARDQLLLLIQLGPLTALHLSRCNLTEQNIHAIILALRENPYLIALDVSQNHATQAQLDEIAHLLARNQAYDRFKTQHRKKDVLDFTHDPLTTQDIENLAFYISQQTLGFLPELISGKLTFVKEIKAPILAENLRQEDFKPLLEALKKNNHITTLTMDVRPLSAEIEQKMRTQLMLNKARQKMHRHAKLINYATRGVLAASFLTTLFPTFSFLAAFLGLFITQLAYNTYFFHRLQQAKSYDFTHPENTQAIERGKKATDSWLAYLNPKTYTPMAYLGYTVEKENLSTKYGVTTPCFTPTLRPSAR